MDRNSIQGDWEKEAPRLLSTGRENPFTVPADYFAKLQEQVESRVRIEQEELKNETAYFKVPEGYFETLENRIMTSVTTSEPKKAEPPVRSIIPVWLRYAAAACIALLCVIGIYYTDRPTSLDAKFSKLPEDEIINYLQIHADAGDLPMLVESLGKAPDLLDTEDSLTDYELELSIDSTL